MKSIFKNALIALFALSFFSALITLMIYQLQHNNEPYCLGGLNPQVCEKNVIAGEIQEYTGRILGDITQEAQGYALEFEGISQRQKGDAKEAFEDLVKHNFKA